VLVLPITILKSVYGDTWKARILYLILAICFVAGIILSFSRGAVIALVAVLAMILWRERRRRSVWFLGVVIILLTLFLAPISFWERLETLRRFTGEASLHRRYLLFMEALELFTEHPLLGIGVGNFMPHSIWVIPVPQVVHNMYLEVAVETGVFGLLALLGTLGLSLGYFKRAGHLFRERRDFEMALILEGLRIGFIGLLVAALFLSIQTFFVLWTVMGLSVVAKHLARERQVVSQ